MIVVTTPTGHIGSKVPNQLVQKNEKVRVLVRDASKLPANIKSKVEIVEGSLDDAATVAKAYSGAEQLFYVIPPGRDYASADDYYMKFGKITCDAIKELKVKRVIYISGTGLGVDKKAGAVFSSSLVEQALKETGAALRTLHCGTFMENVMNSVQSIKMKSAFSTTVKGDAKVPWVATKDIADAAVKLLLDKTWSGQGSVGVLGPEDLSYNDVALMISEVLGKKISYQAAPASDLKPMMMGFGMSEAAAQSLMEIWNSMNTGTFNQVKRTPESSSPTKFKTWCADVLKPVVLG